MIPRRIVAINKDSTNFSVPYTLTAVSLYAFPEPLSSSITSKQCKTGQNVQKQS